jgi:DNA-binding beta-propeller fold protein YncE
VPLVVPRDHSSVRRLVRSLVGITLVLAFIVTTTTTPSSAIVRPGRASAATTAAPALPACSTSAAAAPNLSTVKTAFAPVPGGSPFGVAISPDNRFAFVAGLAEPLSVYSLALGGPAHVGTVSIGDAQTAGVTLTRDGRYLLAADDSGALVFKTSTLEKGGSLSFGAIKTTLRSAGQGGIEVATSPDGHFAFVTLEDTQEMAVFNLQRALAHGFQSSDLVGYVPLGVAPVGIAVSTSGRYLFVTSEGTKASQSEGTLTTVNVAEAERRPSHAVVSTVAAGCNPVRVVATTSTVFVTSRASDAVVAFSATGLVSHPANALLGSVQVGEAPVGLALVNHDTALVVADSNRFGSSVAPSDLAVVRVGSGGHLTLDGYLTAGAFPRDMAVSPNGKLLLVSNFASGQLEAVQLAGLP